MAQRLRVQRWLAGAAAAGAALSPAASASASACAATSSASTASPSASSATFSSVSRAAPAGRPLARAASPASAGRIDTEDPTDTEDTEETTDTTDIDDTASVTAPHVAAPDPAADVPHEAYQELAGNAAGVGRERPGRPAAEPPNPETVLASRPFPVRPRIRPTATAPPPLAQPPPSPPPAVTALGTERNERAADLAAHILPLGTGFALMGLGLGYLGVRLRRGL
ncbi:hypothetical protein ABZZ20_19855 [Streptomyces sp. NPDC006430]|uniref:hypothetical protein n=1 Tax=Streptomyces sp. NPDC006430 TaxID=3154299 RepID=UPI0033BA9BEC